MLRKKRIILVSKALGIALLDFDGDGWLDFFLANDTQPNKLYRNNQDGTFTEAGLAGGVAFGEDPTGVMMPPIDAAQAMLSISAVPKRRRVTSTRPAWRAVTLERTDVVTAAPPSAI